MASDGSSRLGLQAACAAALAVALIGGFALNRPSAARPEGAAAEERGLFVVETLRRRGYRDDAARLEESCADAGREEACLEATLILALNRKLHAEALDLLNALTGDIGETAYRGMRAEALARSDRPDEAWTVLAASSEGTDPFAEYARGYLAYRAGDSAAAKGHLERAIELGRKAPAHLLSALVAFQEGDFDRARRHSEFAVKLDPSDVDAAYNLAVLDQRDDRYHAAREGYLRALRLDPTHQGARYNLTLLTHGAGAGPEARHNLEKFRGLVGNDDPRVHALESLLGPPPPIPAKADDQTVRETGP